MNKIQNYLSQTVWAMERDAFERFSAVIRRHLSGVKISAEDIEEVVAARDSRYGNSRPRPYHVSGSVAVLPVTGVIARLSSQVNGSSQPKGTSAEALKKAVKDANADDQVEAILLDIDSPGGSVMGLLELLDDLRASDKTIHAHSSGIAASAAYTIAAQAKTFTATRGAIVGSIGVMAEVVDSHRAIEQQGHDVHLLTSVPGKIETQNDRASFGSKEVVAEQKQIDEWHARITNEVAIGRGISAEAANELADGRAYLGDIALEKGLIDKIATFEETLAALNQGSDSGEPEHHFDHGASTQGVAATHQENPMDIKLQDMTPEQLQAENPALFDAVQKAGFTAGQTSERTRAGKILSCTTPDQLEAAEKLISGGDATEDAVISLSQDARRVNADRIKQIITDSPEAVEGSAEDMTDDGDTNADADPLAGLEGEELYAAEWKSDPSHKADFEGDFDAFKAYRKASDDGLAKSASAQLLSQKGGN